MVIDTQGAFKIVVIAHCAYGLIIALTQAEQAKVAAKQIGVRYDIAPLVHPAADHAGQVTVSIDAEPNQGHSGMTCVKFVVRLLKNKSFHFFTCRVSF